MSDDLVERLVGKTWYVTDSTGKRLADDAPEEAAAALIAKDAEIARLKTEHINRTVFSQPFGDPILENKRLAETNEVLSLMMAGHAPEFKSYRVDYLFGRPLSEIARILKEHETALENRDG